MKKIFFTLLALVMTMGINAQVINIYNGEDVVGTYITNNNSNYRAVLSKSPKVKATSASMDKTSIALLPGKTYILTATATPSNANQEFSWTSSDPKYVTVDAKGVVTGVQVTDDQVTITATAIDGSGVTATCVVNVTESRLLSGEFTVDGNGTKVKFTGGNLYWNGDSYQIENDQYYYPGETRVETHVSHFFWTSAADYKTGLASFMPYAKTYAYGSQTSTDEIWCGENNKLTIGGESGLFTLSNDQWNYLLGTRKVNGSNKEGAAYQRTTLTLQDGTTTVYGLLIVPDVYDLNSHPQLTTTTSWSDFEKMEEAGVVFLPAAGYGSSGATSIQETGSNGRYWSSTTPNYTNAYCRTFSSYVIPSSSSSSPRQWAYTIRLVKLAE